MSCLRHTELIWESDGWVDMLLIDRDPTKESIEGTDLDRLSRGTLDGRDSPGDPLGWPIRLPLVIQQTVPGARRLLLTARRSRAPSIMVAA